MTDYLNRLQNRLLEWAGQAAAGHWLEPATVDTLEAHRLATPAELFTGSERPLVVGLFGGTGVGKSSLLNRLAREPIARASAERPTSRDITVYVHKSVTVSRLPDDFPMERLRTTVHQRDDYRHVMWIDMPDFDSVEASHRQQVDHWLPHLDVIVYVVSPERYRDDDGWQLLRSHARGHAWLFVMNQWDRGDPAQLEDFRTLLGKAGFDKPMLFTTDSRGTTADGPAGDTLAKLERTMMELADSQLIDQLGELGVAERARSLRELADTAHASIGDADRLEQLTRAWPAHWQQISSGISQAAAWPIERLARRHAQALEPPRTTSVASLLSPLRPAILSRSTAPATPAQAVPDGPDGPVDLFDEALTERIDTGIDGFLQSVPEVGGQVQAVASQLDEDRPKRLAMARAQVDQAVAQSLAQPGTPWQRSLHRAATLTARLLPLLALCWIGLRIVVGYWRGGSDPGAYLGSNFALHSLLLLGVAWALPAYAQYRLQPSRESAAARGLRHGLDSAMDELGERIESTLNTALAERRQLDRRYQSIWRESPAVADPPLPEAARRLLSRPLS